MNIATENITSSEVYPVNLTSPDLVLRDLKTSLLCFNLLIGLPLHSYVLWLIVTGRGIALQLFNFNLTVCEMIYTLDYFAYVVFLRYPSLSILRRILTGLFITGRCLFESLICVERYLAVVHPVTFLKYKPLRYRVICSAAAWIICLASCLCCQITLIFFDTLAYTWFFSVFFLIFLSVKLFCLLAVLRVLKQSGPGERGREREEENHMKRRAFYIILITTGNMIIMCVPFIITGFLSVLAKRNNPIGEFISLSCFILTAFVQPVQYIHRDGKL